MRSFLSIRYWHAIIAAGVTDPGYKFIGQQTKASLEKATWAASFRRVGWDFRPALWATPEYVGHWRRVGRALPLL
jgi:hypothetical protein